MVIYVQGRSQNSRAMATNSVELLYVEAQAAGRVFMLFGSLTNM